MSYSIPPLYEEGKGIEISFILMPTLGFDASYAFTSNYINSLNKQYNHPFQQEYHQKEQIFILKAAADSEKGAGIR